MAMHLLKSVALVLDFPRDPQDWCQERDSSDFPSSLLRFPTDKPFVPSQPNERSPGNAGVKPSPFGLVALLFALFSTLMYG
jgi:hypothetical protein